MQGKTMLMGFLENAWVCVYWFFFFNIIGSNYLLVCDWAEFSIFNLFLFVKVAWTLPYHKKEEMIFYFLFFEKKKWNSLLKLFKLYN